MPESPRRRQGGGERHLPQGPSGRVTEFIQAPHAEESLAPVHTNTLSSYPSSQIRTPASRSWTVANVMHLPQMTRAVRAYGSPQRAVIKGHRRLLTFSPQICCPLPPRAPSPSTGHQHPSRLGFCTQGAMTDTIPTAWSNSKS